MKNILLITAKEFQSYFNSSIAYIFITVFLVLTHWLFFRGFFLFNQATLRPFFALLPWVFLFFVPAITMRLWAEERKLGTMEVLMTLPLKDYEVVLGKFFAGYGLLILTVLLSFPLVIVVATFGDPDSGQLWGGFLGAILLGGAYLSLGLFVSSLSENQIVAFILGVALSFLLLILGESFVLLAAPGWLAPLLAYLGLHTHFESIGRGVLDSRDVIYYLSVMVFFLFLNVRSVESRKWK